MKRYRRDKISVGAALGLVNSPITNTAVAGMPRSQAGVAGATASTARQLGQSLGVAVLGALLNDGEKRGLDLPLATHTGWWVVLVLAVLLAALALLSGTRRAKDSAAAVQKTFG